MAMFQGFMSFGGNCISDWSRTNAYLCVPEIREDACGKLPVVHRDSSCPEDHDLEGYGDGPSFEENPAPWYDPRQPESVEFLGLYVTEMTGIDGPPIQRSHAINNSLGSTLARLKLGGRQMTCKGTMFATSCKGMDYGIRWLNQVVMGSTTCDGCPDDELIIRTCCSQDPYLDPDDGLYTFKRVGVLDPPRYSSATPQSGCTMKEVAWSFFAEMPYIYTKMLDSATITFDEDFACEPTWCNDCPPPVSPCKKDELPTWFVNLSTNNPSDTYFSGVTYQAEAEVYYQGYIYRAIEETTGDQPDTSPTKWALIQKVNTWTEHNWIRKNTQWPPADHYLAVNNNPNVSREYNIILREDNTYTAVDFALEAGIPTDARLIVQNSEQFTGCEDPVYDDIFDSLILTDCACIPPFAVRSAVELGSYGDWVDSTAVIEINTDRNPMRHLVLEFFENPQGLPLPTSEENPWECAERCAGLIIPFLPAGSRLTFDGRDRSVTLHCGNQVQSGEKYVYSLDGQLFSWIDFSCVPLVVTAMAHPGYVDTNINIRVEAWERKI